MSSSDDEMQMLVGVATAAVHYAMSSSPKRDVGRARPRQGAPGVTRGNGVPKRKLHATMDGIEARRLRGRDNPAGWEKLFLDEAHGGKASPFGPGTLRYDMSRRKFRVPLEVFHEMLDKIGHLGFPCSKMRWQTILDPLILWVSNCWLPFAPLRLGPHLRTKRRVVVANAIREFFHVWCKWMVDNKKALWINLPATQDEVSDRYVMVLVARR